MSRSSWDNATLWERIADALADGQERPATEIAELAGYPRQALARAGRVVAVPAPPGSHYPIAGWRLVGGGS